MVPNTRDDSVSALQRFEDARQSLRSYTACKEELLWRIAHRFSPRHKLRKAIERLLFGGLDTFHSRADDCACDYAAGMPGRDFPGYDSPIDVFYGSSLVVPTRVDEWETEQCADGRLAPLDVERESSARAFNSRSELNTLLEHISTHASAFMREVRALPCFRPRWNGKQPRKEGFVVCTSSLDDCEAKFKKNCAAARKFLNAMPLENE